MNNIKYIVYVVIHSLRHTSTGVKLRLSKRDLKAVQGDGGWSTPDMQAVIQLLAANPELLKQALAVAQGAGKA